MTSTSTSRGRLPVRSGAAFGRIRQTPSPHGHGGFGWMMVAACLPMLVIALALVAAGASAGFLLVAVGCMAMMVTMIWAMGQPNAPGR